LAHDKVEFTQLSCAAGKCERTLRAMKISHLQEQNTLGAEIIKTFMDTRCSVKTVDLNKLDKDRDQVTDMYTNAELSMLCLALQTCAFISLN
jgi:hypothetical protein